MDYAALKLIHQTCVAASAVGFVIRGAISLRRERAERLPKLARIAPHLIDSLLLLSALGMVWQLGAGVLGQPWLQAKLLLLLVYIGLGSLALSPRRPRRTRGVAFVLACLSFAGIVASALSKHPLGLDF